MNADEARAKSLNVLISSQTGSINRLIEEAIAQGKLSTEWKIPSELVSYTRGITTEQLKCIIDELENRKFKTLQVSNCSGCSSDYGCSCTLITHLKISW